MTHGCRLQATLKPDPLHAWQAEGAADFLKRVQEAEANVAAVVKELQQSGGSFKDVDAARSKISKLQAGVMENLDVVQVRRGGLPRRVDRRPSECFFCLAC